MLLLYCFYSLTFLFFFFSPSPLYFFIPPWEEGPSVCVEVQVVSETKIYACVGAPPSLPPSPSDLSQPFSSPFIAVRCALPPQPFSPPLFLVFCFCLQTPFFFFCLDDFFTSARVPVFIFDGKHQQVGRLLFLYHHHTRKHAL